MLFFGRRDLVADALGRESVLFSLELDNRPRYSNTINEFNGLKISGFGFESVPPHHSFSCELTARP